MKIIGKGTFGNVSCGEYNGKKYAIKMYTYQKSLFHITTFRELKILRLLNHPNIISLKEIVVDKYQIYSIFPYYKTDLANIMAKRSLGIREIKDIFRQLVFGVQYLHSNNIIHRDLKPANILIDIGKDNSEASYSDEDEKVKKQKQQEAEDGLILKICDFGMSKQKSSIMTPGVVTLWYRSPELLLGTTHYDEAIDIWSLGCILFEMLNKKPLFTANTEIEQLEAITKWLGTIDSNSMPLFNEYPFHSKYVLLKGENSLSTEFDGHEPNGIDLVRKILVLDPKQRISLKECLSHPFLS